MMDANCWPLILPEQDPQAPFPTPIALTVTPTSGRAQIQVHHRPSMSNTTNTMMEWPTAWQMHKQISLTMSRLCKVPMTIQNAPTYAPYKAWPPEIPSEALILSIAPYHTCPNKAMTGLNNTSQPHGSVHTKQSTLLSITYTPSPWSPACLQSQNCNLQPTSPLNTMPTLHTQQCWIIPYEAPTPSKQGLQWEDMCMLQTTIKHWPMDMLTSRDGISPLVWTMLQLPPTTIWIPTYAWIESLGNNMPETNYLSDQMTTGRPLLSLAMWNSRNKSVWSTSPVAANNLPRCKPSHHPLQHPCKLSRSLQLSGGNGSTCKHSIHTFPSGHLRNSILSGWKVVLHLFGPCSILP